LRTVCDSPLSYVEMQQLEKDKKKQIREWTEDEVTLLQTSYTEFKGAANIIRLIYERLPNQYADRKTNDIRDKLIELKLMEPPKRMGATDLAPELAKLIMHLKKHFGQLAEEERPVDIDDAADNKAGEYMGVLQDTLELVAESKQGQEFEFPNHVWTQDKALDQIVVRLMMCFRGGGDSQGIRAAKNPGKGKKGAAGGAAADTLAGDTLAGDTALGDTLAAEGVDLNDLADGVAESTATSRRWRMELQALSIRTEFLRVCELSMEAVLRQLPARKAAGAGDPGVKQEFGVKQEMNVDFGVKEEFDEYGLPLGEPAPKRRKVDEEMDEDLHAEELARMDADAMQAAAEGLDDLFDDDAGLGGADMDFAAGDTEAGLNADTMAMLAEIGIDPDSAEQMDPEEEARLMAELEADGGVPSAAADAFGVDELFGGDEEKGGSSSSSSLFGAGAAEDEAADDKFYFYPGGRRRQNVALEFYDWEAFASEICGGRKAPKLDDPNQTKYLEPGVDAFMGDDEVFGLGGGGSSSSSSRANAESSASDAFGLGEAPTRLADTARVSESKSAGSRNSTPVPGGKQFLPQVEEAGDASGPPPDDLEDLFDEGPTAKAEPVLGGDTVPIGGDTVPAGGETLPVPEETLPVAGEAAQMASPPDSLAEMLDYGNMEDMMDD